MLISSILGPTLPSPDTTGSTMPPRATKLRWDLPEAARDVIAKCKAEEASLLIADLDLHVMNNDAFGKGAIKKCKTSPDVFIQLALQLAYVSQSEDKRPCLTYEASMTRLFKEGRTETVRPFDGSRPY